MKCIKTRWSKPKNNKLNKWILLVLGIIFFGLFLNHFYTHDPTNIPELFYPYCTFKLATGWECLGCGGQRALHSLLHLNFLKALKFNFLYVSLVPVFIYYCWYYFNKIYLNRHLKEGFFFSKTFGYFMIIYIIGFTIIRNIL